MAEAMEASLKEPEACFQRDSATLKGILNTVMQDAIQPQRKVKYFQTTLKNILHEIKLKASNSYANAQNESEHFAAANILLSLYHVFYAISRPEITDSLNLPKKSLDNHRFQFPLKWMSDMALYFSAKQKIYPFLWDSFLKYPLFAQTLFFQPTSLGLTDDPFMNAKLFRLNVETSAKGIFKDVSFHIHELEQQNTPWAQCELADMYLEFLHGAEGISQVIYTLGTQHALHKALELCPHYGPALVLKHKVYETQALNFSDFPQLFHDLIDPDISPIPEINFAKFKLLSAFVRKSNDSALHPIRERAHVFLQRAAFLGHKEAKTYFPARPTSTTPPKPKISYAQVITGGKEKKGRSS